MAHLSVRHKVKDFTAWKKVFDDFIEIRRASGEKSWQIFQLDGDPNNVLILFEFDTLDNARAHMSNPELKVAMGNAGVIEAPEAYFLVENESGTM